MLDCIWGKQVRCHISWCRTLEPRQSKPSKAWTVTTLFYSIPCDVVNVHSFRNASLNRVGNHDTSKSCEGDTQVGSRHNRLMQLQFCVALRSQFWISRGGLTVSCKCLCLLRLLEDARWTTSLTSLEPKCMSLVIRGRYQRSLANLEVHLECSENNSLDRVGAQCAGVVWIAFYPLGWSRRRQSDSAPSGNRRLILRLV